jgi:quercetin dioxygenase-like cupin family protein
MPTATAEERLEFQKNMQDNYGTPSIWHEKPDAWHEVMPGVRRRILNHSSTGMMVYYKIEPGKTFALHDHPHAQFGVILEGTGTFRVGGKTWKVRSGDSYFIPPKVPHELVTEGNSPCVVVDFFTPERDDYLAECAEPDTS